VKILQWTLHGNLQLHTEAENWHKTPSSAHYTELRKGVLNLPSTWTALAFGEAERLGGYMISAARSLRPQ
jgi:hypothetical protein